MNYLLSGITYYRDADSDLYGNILDTTQACSVPEGYVSNGLDCNDNDGSIHPEAIEICMEGLTTTVTHR